MPGYSKQPLIRKIGIKPPMRVSFSKPPKNWMQILGDLPEGVTVLNRAAAPIDCAIAFCMTTSELKAAYSKYRPLLSSKGMLWIAWPKKASGVVTELSDNIVRAVGLAAEMVDVKVCAIDDVWSGLRFVIPVKLRE